MTDTFCRTSVKARSFPRTSNGCKKVLEYRPTVKSATGYSLFVVSDLQFDIKSVRENERESVCVFVCVCERERCV